VEKLGGETYDARVKTRGIKPTLKKQSGRLPRKAFQRGGAKGSQKKSKKTAGEGVRPADTRDLFPQIHERSTYRRRMGTESTGKRKGGEKGYRERERKSAIEGDQHHPCPGQQTPLINRNPGPAKGVETCSEGKKEKIEPRGAREDCVESKIVLGSD